ncbi:MAG TPA: VOC family protein, partial [Ilumatobacter sp.]
MSDRGAVALGRIVQIAYAVEDVRTAAQSFAERVGAGPFFVRHHDLPRRVDHGGQRGAFDHSSAYGQWGDVQVELVQIHDAEPASLADIVRRSTGIHHVATFVASIDDE